MAKDMQAVRFNEKVKRFSTLVGNGGLALFIAAVARWWAMGVELFAVIWISISVIFIYSSAKMNDMLQPEDE